MSKREHAAVAAVLTDPENTERTAEEVAELAIEALDEVRARTHRLAVVGQLRYGPQDPTHTVVLGPFSARGILDTQEKFQRATEASSAARTAGQQLAWDTKTTKGHGRFMLVPSFIKARDAWDFYRSSSQGEELKQLTSKMLIEGGWREAKGYAELQADLDTWVAGRWAEESPVKPGCLCGLTERYAAGNAGYTMHGVPTAQCHLHIKE